MIRFSFAVVVVATFFAPAFVFPAGAQPKADAAKVQKKQAQKKLATGRLPAHYGQIVDDAQRKRIYQIQASYNPKIAALQADLDALVSQRDAEIRAVLTPEQQRRLDARIDETKAAKAAKKADDQKRKAIAVKKAA